jgi:FkbM family methyltransferase
MSQVQPLPAHKPETRHLTVSILHETSPQPFRNDGWFPETGVKVVHRVHWRNETLAGDEGEYCIGQDLETGIIWFHDGRDRIACANHWRIRKYLYRGVDHRFNVLLRDYLGNGLIEVSEGDRVVNFGANIGEVALALNRKGASVLAIEPDPNVLPALSANAQGRRIDIAPVVAWREDGNIDLYVATEKGDTSAINASEDGEMIAAVARRIDTILNGDLDPIHLIVGDAEGAEPEVLLGATETLKRTRYVSLRVGPERNGKCPGPECREILERAGFTILMDENEILIGENGAYT